MKLYRDTRNRGDSDHRPSAEDDREGRPEADGLDNRWSFGGTGRDDKQRGKRDDDRPEGPKWPFGDFDPRNLSPEQLAQLHNAAILRSTAILMALCLVLALPQPNALLAPVFSGYLLAAAVAAAFWGLLTRQNMLAPHLTRWDQAAMLLAASLFAGFFVDPEAAKQVIQEMQNAGGAGAGATGEAAGEGAGASQEIGATDGGGG